MKRLLALFSGLMLVGIVSLPVYAAGRQVPLGSISILTTEPYVYDQEITFGYQLQKRPQQPVLGVFCKQGGPWVYISELSVLRELTGTGTISISNATSSTIPGQLDQTQQADCQAFLWDERGGGQQPVAITNQVFFSVSP